MNTTKVKIQGSKYNATIDGVEWSGIHSGSRFYSAIKEWLEEGNTPEPEFTPEELDAQRITAIKSEAKKRILSVLPIEKQNNTIARMVELVDKGSLNATEAAEKQQAQELWDNIKTIRAMSNDAEADGIAVEDFIIVLDAAGL